MAPGKTTSLDDDFATWKREGRTIRCFTCKADPEIRDFIERRQEAGDSLRSISQFLATRGVTLTDGALKNHFDRGHHL